ncbi:MAG TPA: peptidylprolyl isomerase [Acidobacteriota bacterium]|nr:peptidylprolyl isomerase [Acidobacteriota bacterium]
MRDRPLRIPFLRSAAALCLVVLLASSCRLKSSEQAVDGGQQKDRIALAEVNGQVISRSEFEAFVRLNGGLDLAALDSGERIDMFHNMLTDYLISRRADAEDVSLSEADLENAVQEWMPQAEDRVAAQSLIQRFLRGQKLLRDQVYAGIEVTPQETRNYYNRNYSSFEAGDRIHLLEILVSDRPQAVRLKNELEAGDMRAFREAAQLYSQGASAASGGDLGLVEKGSLPAPFEEVVFRLKPGEISDIFTSGHGFHLFMVEETIPRHQQKYYEVQKEIYVRLLAEKERRALDEFLKQLIRDASISIYDEELRSEWRKRYAETRS